MNQAPRPPYTDTAGRSLPLDLPGFGEAAINDFAYLALTEAEVAGILAARLAQHLMQDRGLFAVSMAWEELKSDVCKLLDPNHAGEWEELLGSEFSGRPDSEIETLLAFAELVRQRTDYHAEWLAHCRPDIPEKAEE